jgi:hypothetical protein
MLMDTGIAPVLIIPARNTLGKAEVVDPVPMYTRFGTVRYCGTIDCVTPETVLTAVIAVGAAVNTVLLATVGAALNMVRG